MNTPSTGRIGDTLRINDESESSGPEHREPQWLHRPLPILYCDIQAAELFHLSYVEVCIISMVSQLGGAPRSEFGFIERAADYARGSVYLRIETMQHVSPLQPDIQQHKLV